MLRRIIEIDEEKCNGCGACASACHEGAIAMVNGKAKLMREDYCDGLGDCLPSCPTEAIRFVEREAKEYDEEAVKKNMESKKQVFSGCPGTRQMTFERTAKTGLNEEAKAESVESELRQWPVQIKLQPVKSAHFEGAHLLIAADCAAYAYGGFHRRFIKNKTVIIGCPKLDAVDYTEKLTEIIRQNNVKSVTVVRMEVPCCGGLEHAAVEALKASGKFLPWQVVTVSVDGRILEQ